MRIHLLGYNSKIDTISDIGKENPDQTFTQINDQKNVDL